jgi:hypothetical protein
MRNTLSAKVQKLWDVAVIERPPKRLFYSDTGIASGSSIGLGVAALTNAGPIIAFFGGMPRSSSSATVQSRIGDIIHVSRISLNMQTVFGTAVAGDQIVKWMLVQRKSSAGSTLSASQFASDWFGDSTPRTNQIRNISNNDGPSRYKILQHGTFGLKETISGVQEYHNWHIEYRGEPLKVNMALGSGGTEGAVDSGGLYIFMYTDCILGSNTTGIVTYCEGFVYFRDQV